MGDATSDKLWLPFFDSDQDKRDEGLTEDFLFLANLFRDCDKFGDVFDAFPNCAPNSLVNEMQSPLPGNRSKSNFVGISLEQS